MALMFLAAAIIAAIAVAGPIPARYEVLKDFQPSIAAVIALVAAGVAYVRATASVRYNRQADAQKVRNEKLGLYLRLRSQIHRMMTDAVQTAHDIDDQVKAILNDSNRVPRVPRAHFGLRSDLDELERAWQRLDFFPAPAFGPIETIRSHVKRLAHFDESEKEALDLAYARIYARSCTILFEEGRTLADILDGEIEQIRGCNL